MYCFQKLNSTLFWDSTVYLIALAVYDLDDAISVGAGEVGEERGRLNVVTPVHRQLGTSDVCQVRVVLNGSLTKKKKKILHQHFGH
jgi:hypothetical protein